MQIIFKFQTFSVGGCLAIASFFANFSLVLLIKVLLIRRNVCSTAKCYFLILLKTNFNTNVSPRFFQISLDDYPQGHN